MKKMTIIKKLCYVAPVGLALCLNQRVSAQDDHWNGTPTSIMWNNPANWLFNGTIQEVPPNDTNAGGSVSCATSTYFGGNVWLDPANGGTVIEVPPGDIEAPGFPQCGQPGTANFNTIYGPEFGCTLNVYGSLSWDWTMAPYSPDPAVHSIINMYNGSSMATYSQGASFNLGDGWWNGPQFGNHTIMYMYGNAAYTSPGGAGLWFGAHLNIYDTASFFVNSYVNMSTAYGECDGTRSLNVGGGTLTLPEGTITGGNSGAASTWITRGILRAYGIGFDTNDIMISDDGTNTYVSVTPLGGALKRVYFKPVLKATVPMGTFQQLALVGDYPNITGVYLSSAEPGVDPASFPTPSYTSSNPQVLTVDANGVATAVGPGSATVSATVGAFTSGNTVTITVSDNPPAMVHRYSFTASSGTTVADSVTSNPSYAATLEGTAALGGGKVTLDGTQGCYVQLPAGIATGMDEMSVETWASFGSPINVFANLFCFGYADQSGDGNDGYGGDYINVVPNSAGTTTQVSFGQGLPGFNGERDAGIPNALNGATNVHIVAVFHPYAGYESLYINGVLAATASMYNNMTDPVGFVGPSFASGSYLAYILGPQSVLDGASAQNPNNYIGWDGYQGDANIGLTDRGPDPTLNGSVAEFRIYSSALNAAQVSADYALGPNQVIGTCRSVSLTPTLSNGNIVISWPTCSAYVTLVSSPLPGNGPWTPVTNGTLAVVGSNYQETIPIGAGSGLAYGLQ